MRKFLKMISLLIEFFSFIFTVYRLKKKFCPCPAQSLFFELSPSLSPRRVTNIDSVVWDDCASLLLLCICEVWRQALFP